GYLNDFELANLKNELTKAPSGENIAIVMHHHPYAVETPLTDEYILKNNSDFKTILNGSNVKLIICGHVHGDYSIKENHVTMESSPATCLQWPKGTKSLNIDRRIGYKIYFFNEGNYKTTTRLW